jgi:hypothetical protein
MTFRKMVNRPDPMHSLATKVESGVQLFGALKAGYDVAKTLVAAGKIAAPYVARGIAMLA